MAAAPASVIAVPDGMYLADRTEITLAFIGTAVLFLPLLVFQLKLIPWMMTAEADTVIEAFGKNEQVKNVFWTLFIALAGLILAQVLDPVTAQNIVGVIAGTSGEIPAGYQTRKAGQNASALFNLSPPLHFFYVQNNSC